MCGAAVPERPRVTVASSRRCQTPRPRGTDACGGSGRRCSQGIDAPRVNL